MTLSGYLIFIGVVGPVSAAVVACSVWLARREDQ